MKKTEKKPTDVDLPKLVGIGLLYLPGLCVRCAGLFLRLKGQAKRSGAIFRNELIAYGIDSQIAEALTEEYLNSSRLRSYLSVLR